jgi:hypothetical protein
MMDKYERDIRFRQWSQNKSNDIEVHRGIDNFTTQFQTTNEHFVEYQEQSSIANHLQLYSGC